MTSSRAAHALHPGMRLVEPVPGPSGSHQLDLLSLRADLRRPFRPSSLSVRIGPFPLGTEASETNVRRFRRRPLRRIPAVDIVEIGRAETEQPKAASLVSPVVRSADTSRTRSVVRDLFFLLVLAATVAGAFYSGRMHAFQRVIVVPAASSARSVVTFLPDATLAAPRTVAPSNSRVL